MAPGVSSAAGNIHEEDDSDEDLSPAERRAQRLANAADRPPIYNAEAMHEKLEDISWPSEVLTLSCLKYCRGVGLALKVALRGVDD